MEPNRREIEEEPDVGIHMSDGTRLSARLWKPVDALARPVPLILEYLPYRKRDGTCARDALTHPYFARAGYACLRVDIRGNGDSHGLMKDEYTQAELDDAVEVIHWAAAQPWCSGTVGMMGISWGGFNALQVAAMAPEPLKAIITLCSTVDRFADDIHYKGGCLLNENLGWGATMWSYSSRAPDPALRPDWREMWLERLEAEPFLPAVWLRHQTRDAYWRHGSVCEDYSAIKAKVLAVGGWGDAYKNAVPQIVENIPGAKGILGPWVHKYPHFAVPEPRIGFLQEALRWWDRWLKGAETGAEADPDMRAYIMDGVRPATWYTNRPGRWVGQAARGTPPETHLWLGDRRLEPQVATTHTAVTSPAHTGMDGGEYCAIWLGPELPGDQRHDDALSATWTSEALDQDLDLLGAPTVALTLTSDQPQAQIAVRLCHVHPDGASTRITYGVLNLSHRDGSATPKPMPVNAPTDIMLTLDHIAYRIPRGHRVRISLSTAYWPLIWPSPHPVRIDVHAGRITLPHPATEIPLTPFAPPEAAEPWRTEELRAEDHQRTTHIDHGTGRVSLRIRDDFGKIRDLDHGLISGSSCSEVWSIHPDDPLSATGSCVWIDELERDGIHLRTETDCDMWCDDHSYHLTASIKAYENETLVFERALTEAIPRDNA